MTTNKTQKGIFHRLVDSIAKGDEEKDFVQALLAMGEDVEVLSPADLRQTMTRHAQALAELYSKV